jgi:hypothetical protein
VAEMSLLSIRTTWSRIVVIVKMYGANLLTVDGCKIELELKSSRFSLFDEFYSFDSPAHLLAACLMTSRGTHRDAPLTCYQCSAPVSVRPSRDASESPNGNKPRAEHRCCHHDE